MSELNELIVKYENSIHDIYKAYRFSHCGLYNLREVFLQSKLDNGTKFFKIEDQDLGVNIRFTEMEIGEASDGGYYQRLMAGSIIAMIYNVWEDNYRAKIAKCLGYEEKNDLKSDVFGDLAKIRHEITHNKFNRSSKIDKLLIFGYLFKNDGFILDSLTVNEIVEKVLVELESMKESE